MKFIALLSLICIFAFSPPILAGVTNGEIQEENNKLNVETPLSPSKLRCWQYGKLLFEEINWRIDSPKEPSDNLHFNNATHGLTIIPMGETFCTFHDLTTID